MNVIMCYNLSEDEAVFYLNSKDGEQVAVGAGDGKKLASEESLPWQVLVDDIGSIEVTEYDASVCLNPRESNPRVSKNCQGREKQETQEMY